MFSKDLAGELVDMCPVLCEKSAIDETCTMPVDESEIYPECVVIRAMAMQAEIWLCKLRYIYI